MRAAWWWIDRWRKSTAYTDMTLAEQGAYRNLLDEIVLRKDGIIPEDSVARASGDAGAWPAMSAKVLRWMKRVDGGWTNETALEVKRKGDQLSDAQRKRANKRWHPGDAGASAGAMPTHMPEGMPPSPSPSIRTEQPGLAPLALPVLPVNGNGHNGAGKHYGSATKREMQRLEADEQAVAVADAWVRAWGRQCREIGVLRAATHALAGGYTVDSMTSVIRVLSLAKQAPERFRERSSMRWTAENKRTPDYVLRPDTLDKLIPEAEEFEHDDD